MKPVPVVFEGCFGWLHPASGRRGVVLCSPHGYEELCAHRAWGGLAAGLAAAGLPTLRFDYHGLGDSAGEDTDPARVRAWLDSIHAAVRRLREDTGVDEVALAGLRLGGLLAAAAAAEIGGITALALVSPFVSGRMAVRETRAFARMMPQPEGVEVLPHRADDLNVAGFALTAATRNDLERIDLRTLEAAPAPRILLLDRPEARATQELAERLRALGAEVAEEAMPDGSDLVRKVQAGDGARRSFARLTGWLADGAEPGGSVSLTERPAGLMMPHAVERPVFFGEDEELFGIYCAPVVADPLHDRPAVIFLNSGATHHIGSGRAWVLQARRLAANGYASLRIDVAGLGDSPARPGRPDNILYRRDTQPDVRAAIDWLEEQGHGRCVVVGLCAGAAQALHGVLNDGRGPWRNGGRVAGVALINPGRFRLGAGDHVDAVQQSGIHRSTGGYLRELGKPDKLLSVLRNHRRGVRLAKRLAGRLAQRALQTVGLGGSVPRWFQRLSAEGRRVLLVYSIGDVTLREFELQLGRDGEKLRGLPNVTLSYLPGADHSVTEWAAQDRLGGLLDELLAAVDADAGAKRAPEVLRSA
ncbi:alpha/beta hydrolase [Azospirillum thermophilum]|nr:alpha/beta hydrolase [Azospirillum thermophilum]